MRSGTSKGLFIHRHHLPASTHLWEPILLSAMGSSQGDGRQINGVGGASSTTSKVAVVERSNRPNVDVNYTFVQVAPDQPRIDMTGNCGNIAAGVGPFALDEGIVRATPGQKEVSLASSCYVALGTAVKTDLRYTRSTFESTTPTPNNS
jgi:2-methylaconitate cis-trans-isomerase PrpF